MPYLDYFDVVDLAAHMLGVEDTYEDDTEIEDAFIDKFNIDIEGFYKLVCTLVEYVPPVQTAITGKLVRGFEKNGCFIVKTD